MLRNIWSSFWGCWGRAAEHQHPDGERTQLGRPGCRNRRHACVHVVVLGILRGLRAVLLPGNSGWSRKRRGSRSGAQESSLHVRVYRAGHGRRAYKRNGERLTPLTSMASFLHGCESTAGRPHFQETQVETAQRERVVVVRPSPGVPRDRVRPSSSSRERNSTCFLTRGGKSARVQIYSSYSRFVRKRTQSRNHDVSCCGQGGPRKLPSLELLIVAPSPRPPTNVLGRAQARLTQLFMLLTQLLGCFKSLSALMSCVL